MDSNVSVSFVWIFFGRPRFFLTSLAGSSFFDFWSYFCWSFVLSLAKTSVFPNSFFWLDFFSVFFGAGDFFPVSFVSFF